MSAKRKATAIMQHHKVSTPYTRFPPHMHNMCIAYYTFVSPRDISVLVPDVAFRHRQLRNEAEFEKFHLKKIYFLRIIGKKKWKTKVWYPNAKRIMRYSTGIQIFKSLTKDQEEIH